jgi:hypothetical protein
MAAADLGASLAEDGYLNEAAACFRRPLAGLPNVDWGADLGLAETILLGGWSEDYDEAREVLDASQARTDPLSSDAISVGTRVGSLG